MSDPPPEAIVAALPIEIAPDGWLEIAGNAVLPIEGRGFNGVIQGPGLKDRIYGSKRDWKVILDTAQCVGLRVIPWVPIYYLDCDAYCSQKWPLCRDLVMDWAGTFENHPR